MTTKPGHTTTFCFADTRNAQLQERMFMEDFLHVVKTLSSDWRTIIRMLSLASLLLAPPFITVTELQCRIMYSLRLETVGETALGLHDHFY
jgi:hypothetical protein